jgi:hypothetical protein
VLNFEGVVQDIVTNDLGVGPVGGDAVEVGELFAAFTDPGLVLVTAVGFERAEPEAPGCAGWCRVEEIGEIGGVIVGGDALGWRGRGPLVEPR